MARLLLNAVSRESRGGDLVRGLELLVSVSRADTGAAVTGLTRSAFRICNYIGQMWDFRLSDPSELEWEPGDTEPSGCYALSVYQRDEREENFSEWTKHQYYAFGIGVRWIESGGRTPGGVEYGQLHQGQTVVRVQSLGV